MTKEFRVSAGTVAGFVLLLAMTSGGIAWWTWQHQNKTGRLPSQQAAGTVGITPQLHASSVSQPQAVLLPTNGNVSAQTKVYWLKDRQTQVSLTPRTIAAKPQGQAETDLKLAFKRLLDGPSEPGTTTTIPKGTQLNQLTIQPDGIHVDLSAKFTTGGGSTSMIGRVGQVLYTASSLEPNVPVWISVDGLLLKTLGGEGIPVEQPLTRQRFEQDFDLLPLTEP